MFSIDVFPEMFEKRKKPQNNDLVNLRWLNYCIDLNILHSRTKILNTHAKFQVYLLPVPQSTPNKQTNKKSLSFNIQSGSLIVNPLGTQNLVHNTETSY